MKIVLPHTFDDVTVDVFDTNKCFKKNCDKIHLQILIWHKFQLCHSSIENCKICSFFCNFRQFLETLNAFVCKEKTYDSPHVFSFLDLPCAIMLQMFIYLHHSHTAKYPKPKKGKIHKLERKQTLNNSIFNKNSRPMSDLR